MRLGRGLVDEADVGSHSPVRVFFECGGNVSAASASS